VFVPSALWYHHHFGLSEEPARDLALHPTDIGTLKHTVLDPAGARNTIDYVDEVPAIRELSEAVLAARDIEYRMPEACYTDPDYEWLTERTRARRGVRIGSDPRRESGCLDSYAGVGK
jgi:hypothetical protein